MINRVRRSNYIPEGTGETSGFVVEDRSGRLVLNLGRVQGNRYIDAAGYVEHTADFAVSNTDSGSTFVFNDGTGSLVASLPKASALNKGAKYTFMVGVLAGGGAGHAVSPDALDGIIGNGFAGTADTDAICPVASDRVGDTLTVQSNGVDQWLVVGVTGTWTA